MYEPIKRTIEQFTRIAIKIAIDIKLKQNKPQTSPTVA